MARHPAAVSQVLAIDSRQQLNDLAAAILLGLKPWVFVRNKFIWNSLVHDPSYPSCRKTDDESIGFACVR